MLIDFAVPPLVSTRYVFTPSRCCEVSRGPNGYAESLAYTVSVTREPGISTNVDSPGLWSATQTSNTNGAETTVTSSVPEMPFPLKQSLTEIDVTWFVAVARAGDVLGPNRAATARTNPKATAARIAQLPFSL